MRIATELSSNWHEMKSRIKARWLQLSNREINRIKGRRINLIGTLMEKFNLSIDEAAYEVDKFWL